MEKTYDKQECSMAEMILRAEMYQDCCVYVAHHHDEYCSGLYEDRSASQMPARSDSQSSSLLPPVTIHTLCDYYLHTT